MPSDTFGEVVRWLENKAAECRSSAKAASTPSIDEEVVEMMAMLRASYAEEADRIAQAARLLEAAGRECRAGRMGYEDGEGDSFWYKARCFDNLKAARAALDALAPEMKEVGR